MVSVAVLDYGIGNLGSACNAFNHLGVKASLTCEPDEVLTADAVVLPGVGAFGACVDAFDSCGLREVVHRIVADNRPLLAICVGMQMLYEGSTESPGAAGLGIFDGLVSELDGDVKRPHMQWNRLAVAQPHRTLRDAEWFYFVHSYAAPMSPEVAATVDYGTPVPAAVSRGNLLATQFHPEKSGRTGLALLSRFVSKAAR